MNCSKKYIVNYSINKTWTQPRERTKYFCSLKGKSCEYANPRGWCMVSACIKADEQE